MGREDAGSAPLCGWIQSTDIQVSWKPRCPFHKWYSRMYEVALTRDRNGKYCQLIFLCFKKKLLMNKKGKGLMVMDTSVVIAGGRGV